jgi:L-threonylcarbamoyladenylate synthase
VKNGVDEKLCDYNHLMTANTVEHAARLLREGKLVAFPTETVYGLGANALDEIAVAKIFAAKNRPTFDPLIVHVYDVAQLDELVTEVPPTARTLIDRFWPGPLTLVLPKTDAVPDLVTAGLPTVAVRMPDHPLALELLRLADVPVAAPSANPFGSVSPTTAEHVAEQLGDRVDYILDGGPCRVGVESTVVAVGQAFQPDRDALSTPTDSCHSGQAGKPDLRLLRPGGVPLEAIEAVVGPVAIEPPATRTLAASGSLPQPSPGMLTRHYAPRTPLEIHTSVPTIAPGERVGLLTLQPQPNASRFTAVETLSPTGDLVKAAARFFAALRRLDALQLDRIVALPFPERGLGRALNDRLRRAGT